MLFVNDAVSAIQFIMAVSFLIMGLSHIVQPRMWSDYFTDLHEQESKGLINRTFMLELWPAMAIVTFHQQWSGPAIVLTIYGWLLLAKCVLAMVAPQIGLRSLAMAGNEKRFIGAGIALLLVGAATSWALLD